MTETPAAKAGRTLRERLSRDAERKATEAVDVWMDVWPDALALWSSFTRLRPPILCTTRKQARKEGLTSSFAMIRLTDQTVVIDLPMLADLDLLDRPLEVLGHEIGHHIAAPASLLRSGQAIARMRVALPGVEEHAPMLANIWADLKINDRLTRDAGLDVAHLYKALSRGVSGDPPPLWRMYLRIYEILWGLGSGTLAPKADLRDDAQARLEGDAQLGARLLRSFTAQWLEGCGRFAALCFPYLVKDSGQFTDRAKAWGDALSAADGAAVPAGLASVDPDELSGAIHPAADPELSGLPPAEEGKEQRGGDGTSPAEPSTTAGGGQRREIFAYGEILKAMGIDLTDHEIAVLWYREQALPHLIPFPSSLHTLPGESLPEGFEQWSPGEPLEDVDWLQSVMTSPVVIPGITTVQRVFGTDDVAPPTEVPLHLDIYVDSSGSMPNPQHAISYPGLAATVLILSALRSGALVQATLWSGARQFHTTDGFTDDREELLRVVLGHFGGGTAFPLHMLRDTYADRDLDAPPAHIVVISDSGVTTIYNNDERGTPGLEIQQMALERARGGGTWVLEHAHYLNFNDAQPNPGWIVERVSSEEQLVSFARSFARRVYVEGAVPSA